MKHWTDVATLRDEIVEQLGEVDGLRMDLFNVVYQTKSVAYRNIDYYGQITEPTAGLRRLMGQITSRLGATTSSATSQPALYHLDQGMGGGKSHALVGLYHLVSNPEQFFATDLGIEVHAEAAEIAGVAPIITDAISVVLCADRMTPGVASTEFGPAQTLHERFLWSLFNKDRDLYEHHRDAGLDKEAITNALQAVGAPVLILIDELTDYGQLLATRGEISEEQAFLNSLFDAVDNVPQVVAVVVMIRSDLDDSGYTEATEEFRDYISDRLERNGITATVADAGDFAAIIRRRLFHLDPEVDKTAKSVAKAWSNAEGAWSENVFLQLPVGRDSEGFSQRAQRTFPFHPDLMDLVESDWSKHTGYQRVRSTVTIFAAAAYYWLQQATAGNWTPAMIGVGDIPLHTQAIEAVLSSGLLHGNDKAIANFRQVAASDVISKDALSGVAIGIDRRLELPEGGMASAPALRMATALFFYSLVTRTAGKRGATKAELLAAVFDSDRLTFQDADIVFGAVTDDEEGLGSLEVFEGRGGNTPTRYLLSTEMTLRMHFRSARKRVTPEAYDEYLWDRTKTLVKAGGSFDSALTIECRGETDSRSKPFEDIDQRRRTRLVVLDPRCWTMLNGKDSDTKDEIRMLLGLGDKAMHVSWAPSVVVACVNTQRRDQARKRARIALAWKWTEGELSGGDESLREDAREEFKRAELAVDADLRRAFQHYAYLVRTSEGKLDVRWDRFESDAMSSLSGNQVWGALVDKSRAVAPGSLVGSFLETLVRQRGRPVGLAEVTNWFWSDPTYPLVSSENDIARAVFQLISGDNSWGIADGDKTVYSYDRPDQLPMHSTDLYLTEIASQEAGDEAPGEDNELSEDDSDPQSGSGGNPTFKRYRLRLPTRSLTSEAEREKMYQLLFELAEIVNPAGDQPDVQLIEFDIWITAATGEVDRVRHFLDDVSGTWTEEDDFL